MRLGAAALGSTVLVVGCGGGPEYFSAPTASEPRTADRQAAYSTGYGNEADIANWIAGNCPTRFEFWVVRLRVEATAERTDDVLAYFPNTPEGVRRIRPGQSHTFVLDKRRGHCEFDGPTGEIDAGSGRVVVATKEGWTNAYGGYTNLEVTIDGVVYKVKAGESASAPGIEVVRSADDRQQRTAEVVLKVRGS